MKENKKRIFIIIVFGILIIVNVFLAFKYVSIAKELQEVKSNQTKVEFNSNVINFTSMFIKKVLQANIEVDFETRLSLENAVRGLKDEEIMTEWQNFTGSKTEAEAQNSVKKLLGILVAKIKK